ncbi:MAG TPA: hypothetical protein VN969_47605 [Streptosporangiaceae bacterium]|nr:hypothetical protein [Streptosporangiaceae bacterium]
MHLEQWRTVLATEPATLNQVGKIHREFGRLGFGEDDRPERLEICARLLDLEELGSLRDLTMGDAGRLISILVGVRDRAHLAGLLTEPDSPAPPLPSALIAAMAAAYLRTMTVPAPRVTGSGTGGRPDAPATGGDGAG